MRIGAAALAAFVVLARPAGPEVSAATPAEAAPAASPAPASPSCPPSAALAGPGLVDPFRPPAPQATALNAAAKVPYRHGKWDDARAQYRAAEAADPEFLAPALNVACSFVRQERFDEATAEVLHLLDRAFVPWSREILTAADLGALKVQPQMQEVRAALAAGARRWGAHLEEDLLFVARTREPLKLPPADGVAGPVVLVLGLHQEVYAWSPATMRYRQITAEDGHVVAFARSADRRRILYVTAEKLVRHPGTASTLRGVVLHALALPAMSAAAPVAIDGDVSRLAIVVAPTRAGFALDIEGDKMRGGFTLDGEGALLVPGARPDQKRALATGGLVVLTSAGVGGGGRRALDGGGGCKLEARAVKSRDGISAIEIAAVGRGARGANARLLPRFGAGLDGLPIP